MSEGESSYWTWTYTPYRLNAYLPYPRGATPETVKKAFEILNADPKVKSIFINIFGGMHFDLAWHYEPDTWFCAGIMRCDYIAEGVIKASKELSMSIPLIVRLKGTKEAEAKQYVF